MRVVGRTKDYPIPSLAGWTVGQRVTTRGRSVIPAVASRCSNGGLLVYFLGMRTLLRATLLLSLPFAGLLAQETPRNVRNAFVRDQTLLGFLVYGPAASAIPDGGAAGSAAYFLMAGSSFFAAQEISRRVVLTEGRQKLATSMSLRGALAGLWITAASDSDHPAIGTATLLGGLGGTAAGLVVGRGATPAEVQAMALGHDLTALATLGASFLVSPETDREVRDGDLIYYETRNQTGRVAASFAGGLVGYGLGRAYARGANYGVTAGDAVTLWTGTTIGAIAASSALMNGDPSNRVAAGALLAGGAAGLVLTDRFLVRRKDHSRSEGNLVMLGATAGGLMGLGAGVLIRGEDGEEGIESPLLAAAGATAGLLLSERYLSVRPDGGRAKRLGGLTLNPSALLGLAARRPGFHSLATLSF